MLRRDGYLQPVFLQVLGIVILVASFIIWVITGHDSPIFIGAALTLIGVGSGVSAIVTVRQDIGKAGYKEPGGYQEKDDEDGD